MNIRSIPVIATLIVIAAAIIMVMLGFWQLGRADEKNALLERYQATDRAGTPIAYPLGADALEANLYRSVSASCETVEEISGRAGTNAVGAKGWAQIAQCRTEGIGSFEVALGWSRAPSPPVYTGGEVTGILAPGGKIVADPPLADLGPLAKPDPADLPNNHLAYAGQWFFFALTALVIYFIALRSRHRRRPDES